MLHVLYSMLITKASGEQELFNANKLRESLERAGADAQTTQRIVSHVETELKDGSTTTEIYHHAFDLLKRFSDRPVAARYSLKRAVIELGPTGFPFEQFVAGIFEAKGFTTRTNMVLKGKCASHEIDVLAEREDTLVVTEAKFHNKPGMKTDLKVLLYVDARFRDLRENKFSGYCKKEQLCQSWLVTNTKFTTNAISYATCGGTIKVISWSYPKEHNLEQLIEETGLHPLTCLTSLSKTDKKRLFDEGHVLCRSIQNNEKLLHRVGVVGEKAREVLKEVDQLCAQGAPQEQ